MNKKRPLLRNPAVLRAVHAVEQILKDEARNGAELFFLNMAVVTILSEKGLRLAKRIERELTK